MNKKLYLRNKLSYRFIKQGEGIEIGATFLPVALAKGLKVKYVDIMSTQKLLKLYPEIRKMNPVIVDVVDDAEYLRKFKDNSLDFIIANHYIEHTIDPIKTMHNFLRVLRNDGIIFLGVPDMRATFDRDRQLTPVSHFINVYRKKNDPDRVKHYEDCVRFIEKKPENEIAKRVKELIKSKYSIHYHTFQKANFVPMVHYMISIGFPLQILAFEDLQEGTDEFIIVMRKKMNAKWPLRSLVYKLRVLKNNYYDNVALGLLKRGYRTTKKLPKKLLGR